MTHPPEEELALYATGDTGPVKRFRLWLHLRSCPACSQIAGEFRELTVALSRSEPEPEVAEWNTLAAEMRANIRLGLEAGACVRADAPVAHWWSPRLVVAMASLIILAGAGFVLRPRQPALLPTIIAAQQSIRVDTEGVTITNVF